MQVTSQVAESASGDCKYKKIKKTASDVTSGSAGVWECKCKPAGRPISGPLSDSFHYVRICIMHCWVYSTWYNFQRRNEVLLYHSQILRDPDLSKAQIPQMMVVMETELQVRRQLNSKGQLCHTRVLYTHNYHNHNYMHYINEPEILCNHLLSCLCNVICNIFTHVNLVTLPNIHARTPEKQFNITMCKAWLGTNFTQRHFGNA